MPANRHILFVVVARYSGTFARGHGGSSRRKGVRMELGNWSSGKHVTRVIVLCLPEPPLRTPHFAKLRTFRLERGSFDGEFARSDTSEVASSTQSGKYLVRKESYSSSVFFSTPEIICAPGKTVFKQMKEAVLQSSEKPPSTQSKNNTKTQSYLSFRNIKASKVSW